MTATADHLYRLHASTDASTDTSTAHPGTRAGSVVGMRVQDPLSDSWVVTVLIVAEPDPADVPHLVALSEELTRRGRLSVAVVTAGATAADGPRHGRRIRRHRYRPRDPAAAGERGRR